MSKNNMHVLHICIYKYLFVTTHSEINSYTALRPNCYFGCCCYSIFQLHSVISQNNQQMTRWIHIYMYVTIYCCIKILTKFRLNMTNFCGIMIFIQYVVLQSIGAMFLKLIRWAYKVIDPYNTT